MQLLPTQAQQLPGMVSITCVHVMQGLWAFFSFFSDNLINISHVPLCSIASTFSFTWSFTHSPILGLFCYCYYVYTTFEYLEQQFLQIMYTGGSIFSVESGVWPCFWLGNYYHMISQGTGPTASLPVENLSIVFGWQDLDFKVWDFHNGHWKPSLWGSLVSLINEHTTAPRTPRRLWLWP